MRHEMGAGHPECPQRVSVIADRLLARGLLDVMESFEAPSATIEQLVRAHDRAYVEQLIALSPETGYRQLDPDTAMNPHTVDAAMHAAGAAVLAAELVAQGGFRRAFCNVRPPGHHAERGSAMGFCFFNNVVVGIRHALDELGMQRIALIDFDVHHGNGSEHILAGDQRVLMVSTFQSKLYPYSGEEALGPNILSVPLAPYSGGQALRDAVADAWLPALRAFKPQMLFISAGFDAHRDDDISQLGWVDADYAWVTRQLASLADELCEGRIVSMLEGGYNLPALGRCAEAHVRGLLDLD
jgi:acetoin utilization deacetylase AcuC-like enzyme